MSTRVDIAPVDREPSLKLRLTAGFFMLSGGLSLAGTTLFVVGTLLRWRPFSEAPLPAVAAVYAVAIGCGSVWTGILLDRGSRKGAILAVGFLLCPVLFDLIARRPVGGATITIAVVGISVLANVWRELR